MTGDVSGPGTSTRADESSPDTVGGVPILLFQRPRVWANWLEKNHATSSGVWLRLAKKASGVQSLSYSEALEAALCYGWVDAQNKSESETTWLQKFTPRTQKGIWSKVNREKALALIRGGQMKRAGFKAVERAKEDGRWDAAYDSQRAATVPSDFQAALDRNARAKAFFATLNARNRYAVLFRIQTVKKVDTRAKRIHQFIKMLAKKEKLHP